MKWNVTVAVMFNYAASETALYHAPGAMQTLKRLTRGLRQREPDKLLDNMPYLMNSKHP